MALAPFRKLFPCPLDKGTPLVLPTSGNLLNWCTAKKSAGTDRDANFRGVYLRSVCEGLIRGVIDGALS